jgi:hypothetical protein
VLPLFHGLYPETFVQKSGSRTAWVLAGGLWLKLRCLGSGVSPAGAWRLLRGRARCSAIRQDWWRGVGLAWLRLRLGR